MPCPYEDKAHAADMKRKIQMTEHKRVKARPLPASRQRRASFLIFGRD